MLQVRETLRLVSGGTERVMILGNAPLPNDEFVFGGWGFLKYYLTRMQELGGWEDGRKESTNRVD